MSALKFGMLWGFECHSLSDDIARASKYFSNKYGRQPNVVHANPLNIKDSDMGIINIVPDSDILPGHLWIGVDEKAVGNAPAK